MGLQRGSVPFGVPAGPFPSAIREADMYEPSLLLFVGALSLGPIVAATPEANSKPTYSKEISRILQKNCEGCHRPGQIGPFALTNYAEASAHARDIKRVTRA